MAYDRYPPNFKCFYLDDNKLTEQKYFNLNKERIHFVLSNKRRLFRPRSIEFMDSRTHYSLDESQLKNLSINKMNSN